MNHQPTPETLAAKVLVRGVHLELTDALRAAATEKAARLLRHNSHIVRIRVDLELTRGHGVPDKFIAKGHIEIGGPDLIASETSVVARPAPKMPSLSDVARGSTPCSRVAARLAGNLAAGAPFVGAPAAGAFAAGVAPG